MVPLTAVDIHETHIGGRMKMYAVTQAQLDFYRRNRAGCAFAAVAAKSPERYGWAQEILLPEAAAIDVAIESAIADTAVTMVSLIFPSVRTPEALIALIEKLKSSNRIVLGQKEVFGDSLCLGFRALVPPKISWISGFGPFDFLPVTRRAPYVEMAIRVKPRPNYRVVLKQAPENVIHLADLDLLGITKSAFETLWANSLDRTAKLLGHKPDLKSAAKTTYAIPLALSSNILETWSPIST